MTDLCETFSEGDHTSLDTHSLSGAHAHIRVGQIKFSRDPVEAIREDRASKLTFSCAPLNSSVLLANSSKLTFLFTFILREWILRSARRSDQLPAIKVDAARSELTP